MANINTIIKNNVLSTLLKESTPVANAVAPQVAQAVADRVSPIVENATNSEPLWKSRIFLSIVTAAISLLLNKYFSYQLTADDAVQINNVVLQTGEGITSLITALSLTYAGYARVNGSKLPPIGG